MGQATRLEVLVEARVESVRQLVANAGSGESREWKLLLALFESMDRRTAAGAEPSTGEILAVLLLPQLLRRMRNEDGSLRVLQVQEMREMTDEILRPIAWKSLAAVIVMLLCDS